MLSWALCFADWRHRSEESRWGLVEVAWALDSELRVVDYRFQRARSPSRRRLERSGFRAQLAGRTASDLRVLLTEDGSSLREGALQVPAGTEHEVTIKLGAPKHVIASRLSIQPESFSRILRNLQREGHITADGNLIYIKDIGTLGQTVAQPADGS